MRNPAAEEELARLYDGDIICPLPNLTLWLLEDDRQCGRIKKEDFRED